MRKYLVNYRVDISATSTIPYLEYTAIYEVESMMTFLSSNRIPYGYVWYFR